MLKANSFSMQVSPSPELSNLVRHFLVLDSNRFNLVTHRLIPDGNPGIVFHYGKPFQQNTENEFPGILQPKSFIYGQITKPHSIISTGNIGAIIVVLKPYAINPLINTPAYKLTDKLISLNEFWGKSSMHLEQAILKTEDSVKRISLIEDFLLGRKLSSFHCNTLVKKSIDWIENCYKSEGISTLIESLPVGKRQLERVFKTEVGVPPKIFANIIRLQRFLKSLSYSYTRNLTEMAWQFGYHDHAHLTREFKYKSGISPSNYFTAKEFLAVNFIQFPR